MKQTTEIGTGNRHKHDFLYRDAVTSHIVVEGSVLLDILKIHVETELSSKIFRFLGNTQPFWIVTC